MANLSRRQQATAASFLQVSRMHFGLCRRRTGLWFRLRRFRRTILQSLLIAGSIGSQFGTAASAETSAIEAAETRNNPVATNGQLSPDEIRSRSPIERMP